ncbi:restriction endonuclease subunit S [Herbaspirillum aquaticum]|uniref:restriction endonuclease subunit S n=1 Tax=Herbaspirillum aquaticum TaxID=568783 RepID=UPI0024DE303B|nr:restriction endonuclease subunit S [Herbaspirillum aquaticum]
MTVIGQLLELFDSVLEVPDALSKLRKFIIELALRGQISPEEVSNIKDLKDLKNNRAVASESTTSSPPKTWPYVLLGDVLQMTNGYSFKPTDWKPTGLPIIRIQNLNNIDAEFNYCDANVLDKKFQIQNDDFLISWSGSFGAYIWKRGAAALNQHIFKCVQKWPAFDSRFLLLAFNSQIDTLTAQAKGDGLLHVNKSVLERLKLPMPPLSEQLKIVQAVEDLIDLCDQLATAQKNRDSYRDSIFFAHVRELQDFNGSRSDLRDHARVLSTIEKLLTLATAPAHIRLLGETVLDIAVQGAFSKTGHAQNKLHPLSSAATLQSGYAFKSEWFTESGVRLLRNTNVGHGSARWEDTAFLSSKQAGDFERFNLKEGDIVLSLNRPFISSGTKVALITSSDLPCLLVQRVGRFNLNAKLLTAEYLLLWIKSSQFRQQISPNLNSGVPHISPKQVEQALIYIPAISEQHETVKVTNTLLAACHRLESQLKMAEEKKIQFLDSVIAKTLGTAIPQKEICHPLIISNKKSGATSEAKKEPQFMPSKPANSTLDLQECVETLGGACSADQLLMHSGLGDNIEAFYDLLRSARDSGTLSVELGAGQEIQKVHHEN